MKGILLDMEGVIRDSKNAFHHAYEVALLSVGLKLRSYPAATWKLRGFAELSHQKQFLKTLFAITKSGDDVFRILWKKYPIEYIKGLVEKNGPNESEIEKMENTYIKTLTHPSVLKRIPPVRAGKKGAKILKDAGFKLGIVTNAQKEYNMAWMADREMLGMFETIINSEDATKPKPAPDMVIKGCEKLKLKPNEIYYLGDSEADIIAAKAAGCVPIGIMSDCTERSKLRQLGAVEVFDSVTDFALQIKKGKL